jgi:hypothetical protein
MVDCFTVARLRKYEKKKGVEIMESDIPKEVKEKVQEWYGPWLDKAKRPTWATMGPEKRTEAYRKGRDKMGRAERRRAAEQTVATKKEKGFFRAARTPPISRK